MARTKKAATKTTAKTASVSETPAKSVVTASEEKAVQAETPKTDDAKASVETKKAAETRMGKGKGNPEGFVARVKPGRILFEIAGVDEEMARTALESASHKLPLKTKIVQVEKLG